MNHFEKRVAYYSIRNDRKIKSIYEPLAKFLGIPFFGYWRVDKNGNIVGLASYAEQCEYYYSEKYYLSNPYLTHPHLIRSGHVWLKSTQKEDFLHKLPPRNANLVSTTLFSLLRDKVM